MIRRENLIELTGNSPTTEDIMQLRAYNAAISQMSKALENPIKEETGKYATLGEAYVDSLENQPLGQGFADDVVDREQEIADQATEDAESIQRYGQPEPMVPTMTEPIQRYGQPEPMVPTMTEPIPEYSQPEEPIVPTMTDRYRSIVSRGAFFFYAESPSRYGSVG